VQPKYSYGMRVRIRARDAGGQVRYRELERYENMTGVVLSSKAIVAYVFRPMATIENQPARPATTLYMYTVKLEEGVTLQDLIEYCLEEI
jgi:hypothetical protein